MAQQQPYTDLSTVKAFLQISDTDNTQDAFLTAMIPMAQTFIDRYTGRSFGWGDTDGNGNLLDDPNIDYSNSDNIGLTGATLNGTLLTLTCMGPVPWQVGSNVSVFANPNSAYNGVWAVTSKPNSSTLVIDISVSKGTLSLSNTQTIAPTGVSFFGYVGNAVTNYKFFQQEQYDGLVGHTLYLRNMDIRSIDTLYIGLRNIAQPVLLDHTQYVWRDDGRLILGGAFFNSYDSSNYSGDGSDSSFYGSIAAGYQTITISYYAGFVGVPLELSLAATDLVLSYYTLRKGMGLQEERVGDYQVRYDITFRKLLEKQPDALNTLNMYRRRHM